MDFSAFGVIYAAGLADLPGRFPDVVVQPARHGNSQPRCSIVQNFNLTTLAFTMAGASRDLSGHWRKDGDVCDRRCRDAHSVALLGARLYIGLSEEAFRKVVLTLLTASGVALLVWALPHLWHRL